MVAAWLSSATKTGFGKRKRRKYCNLPCCLIAEGGRLVRPERFRVAAGEPYGDGFVRCFGERRQGARDMSDRPGRTRRKVRGVRRMLIGWSETPIISLTNHSASRIHIAVTPVSPSPFLIGGYEARTSHCCDEFGLGPRTPDSVSGKRGFSFVTQMHNCIVFTLLG